MMLHLLLATKLGASPGAGVLEATQRAGQVPDGGGGAHGDQRADRGPLGQGEGPGGAAELHGAQDREGQKLATPNPNTLTRTP